MSKGSAQRPGDRARYAENWQRIFGPRCGWCNGPMPCECRNPPWIEPVLAQDEAEGAAAPAEGAPCG